MSVFAEDDAAEPNVGQNEARIGSTEYATLAEAFGAAQSGDTVELLKGAELSGADNPKISKNITLDTNGNTVSAGNVALTVKSGGKLTVKNSSGKSRSLDVALYVESGGTLVANAGAEQTLSDVYLASGGGLVCTGGTIGKLTLTGKGTEYNVKLADGNGHSTISGGISCSNEKVDYKRA